MTFEEMAKEAARRAESSIKDTMSDYAAGIVKDEDDITPYLLRGLRDQFRGRFAGLEWNATVLRHRRGVAAEEKMLGADMLIHVKLDTAIQSYSKGVLVQAKRVGPNHMMTKKGLEDLKDQCETMLAVSPAAYVFDYAAAGMRCASANKIAGSADKDLYKSCDWTAYRFFLELFRCSIGDRKIQSSSPADIAKDVLKIEGRGELSAQ